MTSKFIEEISKARENGYGSLHIVKKSRKDFYCRECGNLIPIGDFSYTQNDYTNSAFIPIKTRICKICGEELIKNGTKVKEK